MVHRSTKNFDKYLKEKFIDTGNILAYNIQKANTYQKSSRVYFPSDDDIIGFDDNIPYLREEVKNQIVAGTYVSNKKSVDREIAATEEQNFSQSQESGILYDMDSSFESMRLAEKENEPMSTNVETSNGQQYIKETFEAHNTNVFKDCTRGNDVWGAWLTKISTPEHPEDYIEIETEGIQTQNLIITNVNFVKNNVIKEYGHYEFDATKFLETKDFADFR